MPGPLNGVQALKLGHAALIARVDRPCHLLRHLVIRRHAVSPEQLQRISCTVRVELLDVEHGVLRELRLLLSLLVAARAQVARLFV